MEGFAPITPVLDRSTSKSLVKDPDIDGNLRADTTTSPSQPGGALFILP